MRRQRVVDALLDLADRLGPAQHGTEWYLFGSLDRNEAGASDIDLLILCLTDQQADLLRRDIDPDCLPLPLDLLLMTFDEAAQVDAVSAQGAQLIYPPPSS